MNTMRRLESTPLAPGHEQQLAAAFARSTGPAFWRHRKRAEAADLLRLPAISPIARCLEIDLDSELRAIVALDVPVPVRVQDRVERVHGAVVALQCRPPGGDTTPAQVAILAPLGVFHPNVQPASPQWLCLGNALPPTIRAVELVWLAFRALALQEVTADERDAAGVLNVDAARYWQERVAELPLTRRSFLHREPTP